MAEAGVQQAERSSLFEAQKSLGADFGVFDGWEMARSYAPGPDECAAVRSSAGLIDLSYYGVLRIWGTEAVQFLNGLVTNDVKALQVGKGMRAGFLTGHGKVRALCRVLRLADAFLVINDPQTHGKILKYVSPFSHAGDFKVEDSSEQYRTVSIQGPRAHLILKEVCFEPVPSLDENDWFESLIAGHRALIARSSHTGESGFDLMVPSAALRDVWDFVLLKGQFHSLVPVGLQALDSMRIEAGIPRYGVDVDETNMMLELGLADAVSFTKGCYTGQEAVAMATYRGHVSKKLSGLVLAGDKMPDRGDIVKKDGKDIGAVTSTTRSSTLGSLIALAYVKYGFFEPNTPVEVQTGEDVITALISELPFYKAPGPS